MEKCVYKFLIAVKSDAKEVDIVSQRNRCTGNRDGSSDCKEIGVVGMCQSKLLQFQLDLELDHGEGCSS